MTQTLVLHSFIVVWNVFQVLLALFRDALRSNGTGAAAMPTARPKGSPATALKPAAARAPNYFI